MVVTLDLGDELGDVVVLGDAGRGDFLPVAVETADEANLRQQVLGPVAGEVEDAVLLSDLRRLHGRFLRGPAPPWARAEARILKENRGLSSRTLEGPVGPPRCAGPARNRRHR